MTTRPESTHSRARKVVPAETIVAVAVDAAAGASRRELLAAYPEAPERLVRAIMQAGMGAEEWQQTLGIELRSLAAETIAQIRQDLRGGKISPNTKGILLGILMDKGSMNEGRNLLRSASVNVTVNNFGSSGSKESILEALEGRTAPKSVLPDSGDSREPIPEAETHELRRTRTGDAT